MKAARNCRDIILTATISTDERNTGRPESTLLGIGSGFEMVLPTARNSLANHAGNEHVAMCAMVAIILATSRITMAPTSENSRAVATSSDDSSNIKISSPRKPRCCPRVPIPQPCHHAPRQHRSTCRLSREGSGHVPWFHDQSFDACSGI